MRKINILMICLCISGCGENYYIREANYYSQLGDYEKSIMYFDKAIECNPYNADTYMLKGIDVSELGNDTDAIKVFTEAIEIDHGRALAYYNRAESYMRLKQHREALDDYNSAIKILDNSLFIVDLNPFLVYADRAVAYYFLDSLGSAWKDLNFCINREQELAQCYYWSGVIRIDLGEKEKGCEDLLRAAQEGYEIDIHYREYCDCAELER